VRTIIIYQLCLRLYKRGTVRYRMSVAITTVPFRFSRARRSNNRPTESIRNHRRRSRTIRASPNVKSYFRCRLSRGSGRDDHLQQVWIHVHTTRSVNRGSELILYYAHDVCAYNPRLRRRKNRCTGVIKIL